MNWLVSPPDESSDRFDTRTLAVAVWRERFWQTLLALATLVPVGVLVATVSIFIHESALFFREVPLWNFLTDTQWTPQFASRKFGIAVIASGTLLVTAIAMTVAVPLGLLAAIYLSEYAPDAVRQSVKPVLESLAAVPTIVYGYFALFFLTPTLHLGIENLSGFNALSAGIATGILITPTISSISEDAIRSVPDALREGGYVLGLTRWETVVKILLPVAFPGIVAAVTLAASRAFSETTIAAVAAGQIPRLTFNPLVPIETMTAYVLQVSLGDVPTQSLVFHAIFTVGLVLFLVTLSMNAWGQWLVSYYGRKMAGWEIPTADDRISTPEAIADRGQSERLPAADFPADFETRDEADFRMSFGRRSAIDRLFAGLGWLASLLGFVVFGLLAFQLRVGLSRLDWEFMTSFPSRNAESSGIYAALAGTLWLMVLTAALAFPLGVGAAIYLEEYLPRNAFRRGLDTVLANLAAVPSILYGLLGLAVFARSWQEVTGGRSLISAALVLAVILLPLLTIATRAALRGVSQQQRYAAFAVGMTRWQTVRYVVLPAALPGILTGILLSLSRAIGETVPLIAIGAVAYVSFVPGLSWEGLQGSFTTLTTQIFYWLSRPQAQFQEVAAAAILVLGGIILTANAIASLLRERSRRR
ncbi:phosphate ABC transporter permease PstA [Baaleninema sp.]|uniref:phosphate ABC transporter permease PstA n=1 Tax=Baaleninema sp. TaxID=3101197 RepID=UPI003D025349